MQFVGILFGILDRLQPARQRNVLHGRISHGLVVNCPKQPGNAGVNIAQVAYIQFTQPSARGNMLFDNR
jgi:hypothetical protein